MTGLTSGIPSSVLLVLWGLVAALAAAMQRLTPWPDLMVPGRGRLLAAALVAMALLWGLRAETTGGVAMHFLGVATLYLMFGAAFAAWLMAATVLLLALVGVIEWRLLPWVLLISGWLPIFLVAGWLAVVERTLKPHLFVYLYGVGFAGGALTAALVVALNAGGLLLFAGVGWEVVQRDYVRYLPLMVLPEAVLNGVLLTGLVAIRPQWLVTYSDDRYLRGR